MDYVFHLDEWLPRCPLRPESHGIYYGAIITGPCDICNNEQLRQEVRDQCEWGHAVPVDIFVMAEGEPKHRHITKIGGLPYRSANRPWPRNHHGQPLLFVAQINFEASRDITGELPGDVLLVFADVYRGLFDSLVLEWYARDLSDLTEDCLYPSDPCQRISPCYGYVYRALSYPDALPKRDWLTMKGSRIAASALLLQFQATQIGEAPFLTQLPSDLALPGKHLCAISSVNPNQHGPYPFINHAEPLMPEGEWTTRLSDLGIGDLGCIYISIDENGDVHYRIG